MRTLTALAVAMALVFSVASANATTHHKKKRHHAASTQQKGEKGEKAPKADTGKSAPAK